MKKLNLFILLFLLIVSLTACTWGFEDQSQQYLQQTDLTKLTVQEKKSQQQNEQPVTAANSIDPNKFEDLASKYNAALIKTNFGEIKVAFYNQASPMTVNNFMNLAQKNFYQGTKFHRVINDFMIQAGDPNSKDNNWSDDGQGGPGYRFQDEINSNKLVRGSLAMANAGANTNGSQFFIVTKDSTPWLDGLHTNFGYVVDGMSVVEAIEAVSVNENSHPLEDVIIEDIELLLE